MPFFCRYHKTAEAHNKINTTTAITTAAVPFDVFPFSASFSSVTSGVGVGIGPGISTGPTRAGRFVALGVADGFGEPSAGAAVFVGFIVFDGFLGVVGFVVAFVVAVGFLVVAGFAVGLTVAGAAVANDIESFTVILNNGALFSI